MKETVTLDTPFTYENVEYKDIDITPRMKAKELLKAEREMTISGIQNPGDVERTFYLVVQATGLPAEVIGEVDGADYMRLSGKVESAFLRKGTQSGKSA